MKRLFGIIAAVLIGAQLVIAQEPLVISPELEAQMSGLEAETRSIRQLDGESVERAFPTREETIAYLQDLFDTQLPIDEAARYQHFYVALGLIEPEIDLRAVYLALLGSQVAGFYDSDTQVMNVVPLSGEISNALPLMEQIIYVHEYTHALQDQFFGLDRLLESEAVADHPDRSLATISLVEGDASTVMTAYTQQVLSRSPMAALQLLGEGLLAGNLMIPEGTPTILTRELLFPYEGGQVFVISLYEQGGWELINRAFRNPPVSTEQIIHPDKYIAGEQPLDVSLLDATSALGEGWAKIWDTRLGEWYLREHLRTEVGAADALRAAAGWGGDRFQIYHDPAANELAWMLHLAWDTPEDAREFEATYAQFGEERYGADAQDGCWNDAATATCFVVIDQDEAMVIQAPTVEQARAMLSAQEA